MKRVDLNADIAEGFPFDQELIRRCSSVNIGLGAHAGSFRESHRIAILAQAEGINVGAHPGYPDRAQFGRVSPSGEVPPSWVESVLSQLDRFLRSTAVDYVKPHGALYHDLMAGRPEVTEPFTEWLAKAQLPLMGMKGTGHEEIANEAEVALIAEGFVDRGYGPDGLLIPRGRPGAELTSLDQKAAQAVTLADLGIVSLCLHGDHDGCLETADAVLAALAKAGYVVREG